MKVPAHDGNRWKSSTACGHPPQRHKATRYVSKENRDAQ